MLTPEPISTSCFALTNMDSLDDSLSNIWSKHDNSIYYKSVSFSPPLYKCILFSQEVNESVFTYYEYDPNLPNDSIYQFSYKRQTWDQVDSILTYAWSLPETLPSIPHEDGGNQQLLLKKDGKTHRVFRDATNSDSTLNEFIKVLRFDLYIAGYLKNWTNMQ